MRNSNSPRSYLKDWYCHSIHMSNPVCISLKGCQGQIISLTMSWCPDIDRHTGHTPGAEMQQDRRYGSHNVFGAFQFSFLSPRLTIRAPCRGRCTEKDRGWDSWAPAAATDFGCCCMRSHFRNHCARKTDATVQILVSADLKKGSLSE